MKPKCLFIHLYTPEFENRCENLGLGKLVYVLRENNLESTLLYRCVENFKDTESVCRLAKEILEIDFDVLGIPIFSTNISYVDILFEKIKQKKDFISITGGFLASVATKDVLDEMDYVDYVFCGMSEDLIVDFCMHIDQPEYLSNMKNIAYKLNNQIILNKRMFENKLQNLQKPADREYLKRKNIEVARLQTARGCTAKCAFCTESEKWVGKSPQEIVDEIRQIIEVYGLNTFNIVDSSFEDPTPGFGKERIKELCHLIIDNGLDIFFTIYIRAESFIEEDRELLKLMKYAGLITAFVGVESGNEETLRLFNKRASVDKNSELIKLMEYLSINLEAGFIMFHPYTTFNQLKQNLQFFRNNRYIADNISSYTNALYVYPNTRIYRKLLEDRMLKDEYSIANSQAYDYIDEKVVLVKEIIMLIDVQELYQLWEYLQGLYNVISKAEKHSFFENIDLFRDNCNSIKNELINFNIYLFQETLNYVENNIASRYAHENLTRLIDEFDIASKFRSLDRFKFNFIKKNIKNVDLIIRKPKT